MHSLMNELHFIQYYLDNLLILTNSSFEDHLEKVNSTLEHLYDAGLKVHTKKCKFTI